MANGYYRRALRLGQKEYTAALSSGEYPYLQVLDELTANVEIVSEVPLGLCSIRLEQVVGTASHGRSAAFARNFMPLLDEDSEFSRKWSNLSEIHVKEGIRDPIRCYEFMNRYYVVEGNKRISILKFFGAVEFQADVTRMVMRADDSERSRVYGEFLKFYKVSRLGHILFSSEGDYDRFLTFAGLPRDQEWGEEERRLVSAAFDRFRAAFSEMGGAKLNLPAADAFLEYVRAFPLEGLSRGSESEIRSNIESQWQTYELKGQEEKIAIQMQPPEEFEKRSLVNLFTGAFSGRRQMKVAFVHDRTAETSAWTLAHDEGRRYIEETFPDDVVISTVDRIFEREKPPHEILCDLAKEGNEVVFTTSARLIEDTWRAAIEHPEVKFLNCSLNMAYSHIRTYYGRMYEAKFLGGLIAGIMTHKKNIAYVADYPIPGVIASINAFARGVELTNPKAKVRLIWSTKRDISLEEALAETGADTISRQDYASLSGSSRPFGLYQLSRGRVRELALPSWNYGKFYERILRSIQTGSWDDVDTTSSPHTISYWWGLASGVIDLKITAELPESVRALVDFFRRSIVQRTFAPFEGFIYDQKGVLRSQPEGYMPTADIVTMDYLLHNIEGCIPGAEELKEGAQKLLMVSEEGQVQTEGLKVLKTKI